jgi:hypothetical protein
MLPTETMDSIRKTLKRPIPMQGLERRVYAAVILLLICWILWSFLLHDWQYFERSGSLVIVVAMALGWRDHVRYLGNIEKIYQDQFARLVAKLDATRPSGIVAGAIHDRERQDVEAARTNVEELISLLRRRLRTTEVVILCLGTILWGYGSVIGNLIWCFGNA